jgi:2-polyprenyl-6-methoxyphenol hydroxylase-like FAD-dependent oxidoreductase
MRHKPIRIIGGGLAGLTLGIGLRNQDVPVTVIEAGAYPRHRVCGEFINGRGQKVLEQFGFIEGLKSLGATEAQTVKFWSGESSSPMRYLRESALCLSRFRLDTFLAEEFARRGGDLRSTERHEGDFQAEGLVRATGRRYADVETGRHWHKWFGLKMHARKLELWADLEMHSLPGGYVGLCRIENDEVNICGLFDKSAGSMGGKAWIQTVTQKACSDLAKRLAAAELDETSFCAVAGISLRRPGASKLNECALGDSFAVIPPVTGNGMSVAFESAALAVGPLTAYSRREISWAVARQQIGMRMDKTFKRRLIWAGRLQRLMLLPPNLAFIGKSLLRSQIAWSFLFSKTR